MTLKRKKPEPYKELRAALAEGAACDSGTVATLLRERDMLREALAEIKDGAPPYYASIAYAALNEEEW